MKHIATITNLNHQLYNTPLYYFIKFRLQNRDIWVQYYKGEQKEYNYASNGEDDSFSNTTKCNDYRKKKSGQTMILIDIMN